MISARDHIRCALLDQVWLKPLWNARNRWLYARWKSSGKPTPPPHIVKEQTIQNFADEFHYRLLVETGTYLGDMMATMQHNFDQLYSIELSDACYQFAKHRFHNQKKITILQGDSGDVLEKLLLKLDTPVLFWLDGHYSGGRTAKGHLETPIMKELELIYQHPLGRKHVILIDDARCFTGKDDYPTIEWVKSWAHEHQYNSCDVEDDIIRIYNLP